VLGLAALLIVDTLWDLELNVPITALAGAIGSTLAGFFKLRELVRITDLRFLKTGMYIQPVIGAAAALLLLVLLESGILELPGARDGQPSTAALATYGFIAGYSEPFFLGVVRRVAGSGDGQKPSSG